MSKQFQRRSSCREAWAKAGAGVVGLILALGAQAPFGAAAGETSGAAPVPAGTPPGPRQPVAAPGTNAPGQASAPAQSVDPGVHPASRCDADCVRANSDRAVQACAPRIEAESATDFDWIQRPIPSIFQQAEQASSKDAIVRYRGDSIRFQTPTKEWIRVTYECGYDVEVRKVQFINIRPGRLDRPAVASATPSTSAKPVAARTQPPQVAQQPSPGGEGSQPGAQNPLSTQQGGPQIAKVRPGRVGEPGPLEIYQQPPRVK